MKYHSDALQVDLEDVLGRTVNPGVSYRARDVDKIAIKEPNLKMLVDPYFYLATPYSKFRGGLDEAARCAAANAAVLIRRGVRVYSPIAHTHPIAIAGQIDPLDHNIWLPADAPFMHHAFGLIICKMDGWEESYGIQKEIEAFEAADKPVFYMQPLVFPISLEVFAR